MPGRTGAQGRSSDLTGLLSHQAELSSARNMPSFLGGIEAGRCVNSGSGSMDFSMLIDEDELAFSHQTEDSRKGMAASGWDNLMSVSFLGGSSSSAIPITPSRTSHFHKHKSVPSDSEVSSSYCQDYRDLRAQPHSHINHRMPFYRPSAYLSPLEILGANGLSSKVPAAPMPSPIFASRRVHLSVPLAQSLPDAVYLSQVRPQLAASPRATTTLSDSLFTFKASTQPSMDQMLEKQRKRKESHNAVERRRRDHINEMIQRLSLLVEASMACRDSGLVELNAASRDESIKLNKGDVLERSVRLIINMRQLIQMQITALSQNGVSFAIPDLYSDILNLLSHEIPFSVDPSLDLDRLSSLPNQ